MIAPMNAPANAALAPQASPAPAAPRPFFWSVRREIWEHRSITLAPVAVAIVALLGFLISTIGLPERRRAVLALSTAMQQKAFQRPYDVVAMVLIATGFLVGVVYCLDALFGERRDRSLLFWKSLPVSDRTAVLAKASVPLVFLPALTFVLVVATQLLMYAWSTLVLALNGLGSAAWTPVAILPHAVVLLYGLVTLSLWHAPLYGWLLLISAWARRAPFLWAVLPFFVIAALERIVFDRSLFGALLRDRLTGGIERAFEFDANGKIDTLSQLTPARLLAAPGLWLGLVLAALFLGLAARLRRERGPT